MVGLNIFTGGIADLYENPSNLLKLLIVALLSTYAILAPFAPEKSLFVMPIINLISWVLAVFYLCNFKIIRLFLHLVFQVLAAVKPFVLFVLTLAVALTTTKISIVHA